MNSPRTETQMTDLFRLRSQLDRQVTVAVTRNDWDHAAEVAKQAEQVTAAISRLLRADADPAVEFVEIPIRN